MDPKVSNCSKPSQRASDLTDVSVTKGEGVVENAPCLLFDHSLVQQPSNPDDSDDSEPYHSEEPNGLNLSIPVDGGTSVGSLYMIHDPSESEVEPESAWDADTQLDDGQDPYVEVDLAVQVPLDTIEDDRALALVQVVPPDAGLCMADRDIDPLPPIMTRSCDLSPQNQPALVLRQPDVLSSTTLLDQVETTLVSTENYYPRVKDPPSPPPPLPIQLAMDEDSSMLSSMSLRANNPLLLPPLTICQGRSSPLRFSPLWLIGLRTAPGQKGPSPLMRIWFFWWKQRLRTSTFHFRIPKSFNKLLDYLPLASGLYQRGA